MKKMIKIFKYLIVISFVTIILVLIFTIIQRMRNKEITVFGVSSYIILSDSMKPLFSAGDLIVTRHMNPDKLVVGDVITYVSRDPLTFGETITHEIHAINTEDNQLIITTKGINLDSIDQSPVLAQQIKGKYWFNVPRIGYFIEFMRTDTGFLLLFVLPISVFVLLEGLHFSKLYKAYVKENVMNEIKLIDGKEVDVEALKKALKMIEEEKELINKD